MIIHIYPAECALHKEGDVYCRWTVHRFYPFAADAKRTSGGFVLEITPRPAVMIKAPFAKMSADNKWLELVNDNLYDAGMILTMARNGHRYLSIVGSSDSEG